MMAQARPATHAAAAGVQVIAPEGLGATAVAALRARGLEARKGEAPVGERATPLHAQSHSAIVARAGEARPGEIIACALEAPPGVALAA
ncbi:MAG: hypothetical protein KF773_35135, partial [Deltaproteobacteria bacterium]|nr:hypothetical protein [Deltaproteobacteria bacterium]